jgi:2-polyprenyl-3-methyl-5-hydroxy-6-metoxy-1,4-benzoquinol methylase
VLDHSIIPCPICGEAAMLAYFHPEANIHRCPKCTHVFSDVASIRASEHYSAEYYEEAHRNWFAHPNVRLFGWIESQLPKSAQSVVDIGCGRGQFLDFMHHIRPNLRLVGVDLSSNADREGIQFVRGNALDLELGTFDAVVSLATIEHVADVTSFAARLFSLCKPGGVVIVMTLDNDSLLYRVARVARRLGVPIAFNRLYSAHHLHHFTTSSLAGLFTRNGFHVVNRLHHSVPLQAIDVPVKNPIARWLFLAAAAMLLVLGDAMDRSYLQTIVATRPAVADV